MVGTFLRASKASWFERRTCPGDEIVVQSQSSAILGEPGSARSDRTGAWAWGICWLMFASTVLNYMDRQAIALVGPQIKSRFVLDNPGFGWVLAAFHACGRLDLARPVGLCAPTS